jgi:hypothetical protein
LWIPLLSTFRIEIEINPNREQVFQEMIIPETFRGFLV